MGDLLVSERGAAKFQGCRAHGFDLQATGRRRIAWRFH
jgi:hypothetical protein